MLTWFVDHMHLISHAMMIECFHVYILWWSHAQLPVCLWAHMLGRFDDYLLLFWNASMIACLHASIFTCLISTHMCTHLDDVYWLEGKSDHIVGRFNAQMSWQLCLNVEMIERLEVCVLECLNAYMHVCSHDHILVCSQALLITYSHLTLLWW